MFRFATGTGTVLPLISTNLVRFPRYYGQKGDSEERVELPAGGSHTFPEKVEDMGTWQAVQKISHIR